MSPPSPVRIVDLPQQPYVFVQRTVTMTTMYEVADRLPEVPTIRRAGVTMTDAPFFRYLLIDMPNRLDVEAGVPVSGTEGLDLPDDLQAGVLPAGHYATYLHRGHPGRAGRGDRGAAGVGARRTDWDVVLSGGRRAVGLPAGAPLHRSAAQPDMNQETELAFWPADAQPTSRTRSRPASASILRAGLPGAVTTRSGPLARWASSISRATPRC